MATILVVDDYVDAATVLAKLLQKLGHFAYPVTSPENVKPVCEKFCPDIALVDIYMPVMDGFEVAHQIHEVSPQTRVIALTGSHPHKWEHDGLFERYIMKPASLEDLKLVINGSELDSPSPPATQS